METLVSANQRFLVCVCVCVRAQLTHCMADLSLPVLVLAGLGLFLSSRDR